MGITESPNLFLFLSPPLPTSYPTDTLMEGKERLQKNQNKTRKSKPNFPSSEGTDLSHPTTPT